MSKIYELSDEGIILARRTNYPDNRNFALIHCLYKVHRASAKTIADLTGMGKGEVAVALSNCVKQGIVVDIGEVFT